MNPELCKTALAKIINPNILVNLMSRRVRQLNSGGGAMSRPLINNYETLGLADICLREIIEDKIGYDPAEASEINEQKPKRRKKS